MTLCALSKQPQIVFVLLELMVYPLKELRRRWHRVAIVVLPGLILSPLWVVAVSAEIAAWRLQLEEHHPPEHFDPLWKLHYMWEHPVHFPLATWRALSGWGDRLWQELIGILGWQDVLLRPWTYLVLTILLMLVPLQKLQLDGAARARVIVMTGLTVLGYVVLVYLIFFLTYTPLDVDHVRGRPGTLFRCRAARGRDLRRRRRQSETAGWNVRADCDCRGDDLGNRDGRSAVPGTLVRGTCRLGQPAMAANGMVRPCSCPTSDKLARGA